MAKKMSEMCVKALKVDRFSGAPHTRYMQKILRGSRVRRFAVSKIAAKAAAHISAISNSGFTIPEDIKMFYEQLYGSAHPMKKKNTGR